MSVGLVPRVGRIRRRRVVLAGFLVAVFVVGVGVWWVSAPLPSVGLKELAEVDSVLPVSGDRLWGPVGWDCADEPCRPESRCDDVECERGWYYVSADRRPEDVGVFGEGQVYGERYANSGNAAWAYHWTRPAQWIPWETAGWELPVTMEFADDAGLRCYYNRHWDEVPIDGDGCVWEYWARYGQFVIGFRYGSDPFPLSPTEFETQIAQPLDRYIARIFALSDEHS